MVTAEKFDVGFLREAAEKENDESILTHIRGKNCVAIEIRYHKTCHLNYCCYITSSVCEKKESGELYKQNYDDFCTQVIMKKIIQQKKVHRMTKLHEKFVKTVEETEGVDATNYQRYLLKARLQRHYPQLVFHQPDRKTKVSVYLLTNCLLGKHLRNLEKLKLVSVVKVVSLKLIKCILVRQLKFRKK